MFEDISALPRSHVCCSFVVAMSQEPPPKRIRRIMMDFDWPEWTKETTGKRVRVLEYLLANPNATAHMKYYAVLDRMANFEREDEIVEKLRHLWDAYKPADGTAEESGCLLEISTLMSELFLSRSVIYSDEANDAVDLRSYC